MPTCRSAILKSLLRVLVHIIASSHSHAPSVSSCLGNWNQIKAIVLTKKTAFLETNNGSDKFLTKEYVCNEN